MAIISDEDIHLSQMVRNFIELDESSSSFPCANNNPSDYWTLQVEFFDQNPTTFLSLQEILESVTDSEAEILGKILFYWREVRNLEAEKLRKWIVSRLRMDDYEASLCTTSWVTTFGRPSAFRFRDCYEYIDVMMKSDSNNGGESLRLIVDTDFRSQFELGRPTQAYKELSNSLPTIFVGTEDKLHSIISLLCAAAKQSLKENGLHVPPWRKASYMHSKWLSENCKKSSFSPPLHMTHIA
nr:uncharacterized protein LOC109184781 [Ipomoea batatas]GME11308.1 uncharacterized protein LOC109184781 [Ipomoea batatas]GME11312.1 uncharacterized protein LOC109184781 [Ipomoea batatas]